MLTKQRATVEDLYHVPENGKAELVDGKLVKMSPTGGIPGLASLEISVSLRHHSRQYGGGHAIPDNTGFVVNLPNRESFSPDAAWYTGNVETMKFLSGAPAFAAEVRSEGDYEPKAERQIKQKIKDYFAAGTLVVWDVDLQSPNDITAYHADSPHIFRRDETANAEPAVPGWRFPVNELFL